MSVRSTPSGLCVGSSSVRPNSCALFSVPVSVMIECHPFLYARIIRPSELDQPGLDSLGGLHSSRTGALTWSFRARNRPPNPMGHAGHPQEESIDPTGITVAFC